MVIRDLGCKPRKSVVNTQGREKGDLTPLELEGKTREDILTHFRSIQKYFKIWMAQELNRLARRLTGRSLAKIVPHTKNPESRSWLTVPRPSQSSLTMSNAIGNGAIWTPWMAFAPAPWHRIIRGNPAEEVGVIFAGVQVFEVRPNVQFFSVEIVAPQLVNGMAWQGPKSKAMVYILAASPLNTLINYTI